MDVLHATSRKRETYQVEITNSLLWECALGVAAATNDRLLDTLEKSRSYWETLKGSLSEDLQEDLNYVEKQNTWKALLQLLHQKEFTHLEEFLTYINNLSSEALRYQCIPFIGNLQQEKRAQAASGDKDAVRFLQEVTKGNSFFPSYIQFICEVELDVLKSHLIRVMQGWYEAVIQPEATKLEDSLLRDAKTKEKMKEKLHPEKLVEWATGGIAYVPEPSVYKVLLIPQFTYRPWNVEADLEGTKVFYYPIANESLQPDDTLMPSHFLVQKHKALGDEVRLRIVKLLSKQDLTLQQLTEQLDMGKTTIHHHVKILKSAKLVDTADSKYTLRQKSLETLSVELSTYLELD